MDDIPGKQDKFLFSLEDLLAFVYPSELQHPLAAGRLFAFAMYGPLNPNGKLCSGARGTRVVAEYELDEMCLQLEKEDIIQIYLHNPNDMPLLSIKEQDAIVSQADAHLKREKGKAMLPKLSKETVRSLFEDIPRNSDGLLNFHEVQKMLIAYRLERIHQYKQVFPSLTQKGPKLSIINTLKLTSTGSASGSVSEKHAAMRRTRVSDNCAPVTMFQRMKGQTNPDLIEQTAKHLNKSSYKIIDLDAPSSTSVTSNVRLLRDVTPCFQDPYETQHERGGVKIRTQDAWNGTCNMSGVGLGSKVKAAASSSTWNRKCTTY